MVEAEVECLNYVTDIRVTIFFIDLFSNKKS